MPTTPGYIFPYPAYTDPADVPEDIRELAQAVENQIAGDRRGRTTRVYQTVQQTVPVGSGSYIAFNAVEYDQYGFWNAGAGQMVLPYGGTWLITARVEFDLNSPGGPAVGSRFYLELWRAGSVPVRRGPDMPSGGGALSTGAELATQYRATALDALDVRVTAITSEARLTVPGPLYTSMEVAYLGP